MMQKIFEIERFAARLNEIFDDMQIPPKGKGRQLAIAKWFKVSQGAARKRLEAEAYPTLDKIEQIVRQAGVSYEWLMTGRGPKKMAVEENHPVYLNDREANLIENFRSATDEGARIIERLAQLETKQAQTE